MSKVALLDAYLSSFFETSEIQIDLINQSCEFYREEDESLQHTITIHTEENQELKASSLKAYNMLKLQFQDFLSSVAKITLSLMASKPETIQTIGLNTIAGWLLVLFEFNPLFKHEFSSAIAKTLYAIALLQQDSVTKKAIRKRYQQEFGEELEKSVLDAQLRALSQWKCLLPTKNGYYFNETIQIVRSV